MPNARHSFLRPVCLFLGRWLNDRSGNYAMIFALCLVPALVAIGAAVDLSRAYTVRERLSRALDAAGLAVGTQTGMTNAQLQAMAQSYFDANYPSKENATPGTVTVTQSGQTITLTVQAKMPTSFLGLVGINNLDVAQKSEITKMGKKLEVVLVLDTTGSMSSSSKLSTMKTAAQNLIDTVAGAAVNTGDVKVSIVPFSVSVDVGTSYSNANWLKWSYSGVTEVCDSRGRNCSQQVQPLTISKSGWGGCVTDRDQNNDASNIKPVTTSSATLYPADPNTIYNANCAVRPIVPLSSNWTMLKNEIAALAAGGATNTTIGLAWGWTMLTQGGTLSAAAAPDPEKLNKVIVFLTDGLNTYYRMGAGCDGSNSCSGADTRTALVCENIKKDNIQIYAIRVMDGNATLLRNCASDPSMYYNVTAASQLTNVFASIAQALSNLRISR